MLRHIRSLVAAAAVAGLLAVPSGARADISAPSDAPPPMVDVVLLRPMGLLLTAAGGVLFVPAAAITVVTRPMELHEPFDFFIRKPIYFTFGRPIGQW